MDVKFELARQVTADFHGAERPPLQRRTSAPSTSGERCGRVAEFALASVAGGLHLVKALVMAELAPTNAEARRLVQQGGVRVDGETVRDPFATLPAGAGTECSCRSGKRRFARIRFG